MAQIPETDGFRCPNCGKRLPGGSNNKNQYLYGSPIRYCKKCKRPYLDRTYHEIAVDGFPPEEVNAKTGLKMALIGLIMFVTCSGIFITEIMYSDHYFRIFPMLAILGLVFIVMGIVDTIRVKTGLKAKSLEKKRQESLQRLRDKGYAVQLAELGYNVPREFLPEEYLGQLGQAVQEQRNAPVQQ